MADTALPAVRRERLRIAIQKKGRLGEPARALLSACGLAWRETPDRLFCHADNAPVDLLLVRDDDIPRLLLEGHCEWGIVGRNVLGEQLARVREQGVEPAVRGHGLRDHPLDERLLRDVADERLDVRRGRGDGLDLVL